MTIGPAPRSPLRPVFRSTSAEDGLSAEVFPSSRPGFAFLVVFSDVDAGEVVGLRELPEGPGARGKAEELAKGFTEGRGPGA